MGSINSKNRLTFRIELIQLLVSFLFAKLSLLVSQSLIL